MPAPYREQEQSATSSSFQENQNCEYLYTYLRVELGGFKYLAKRVFSHLTISSLILLVYTYIYQLAQKFEFVMYLRME